MSDDGRTTNLTKARARQIVRRHTRGYMKPSLHHWDDAYMRCPLCHGDVALIGRPFERRYREPSAAEWDATMMRHLLDPEDEDRCPQVASVRPGSEWKE